MIACIITKYLELSDRIRLLSHKDTALLKAKSASRITSKMQILNTKTPASVQVCSLLLLRESTASSRFVSFEIY